MSTLREAIARHIGKSGWVRTGAWRLMLREADGILDIPELRTALATPDTGELDGLVCSLCLFVGDSEDPTPITILNGNLTCEPHNGYFQGGDNTQAIIAWKREHPRGDSDTR